MNNENNINRQMNNGQMMNNTMSSTPTNMNNNMMRNNVNNRMMNNIPSSNRNQMADNRGGYGEEVIPTGRMATSKSINAPIHNNGMMPNPNMNRNNMATQNINGQNPTNRMQNSQENPINMNKNTNYQNMPANHLNNNRPVENSMYSQNSPKQAYQANPFTNPEMVSRTPQENIPTNRENVQNDNNRINPFVQNQNNSSLPKNNQNIESSALQDQGMNNHVNEMDSNTADIPVGNAILNHNISENIPLNDNNNYNNMTAEEISKPMGNMEVDNIDNNMQNIPLNDNNYNNMTTEETSQPMGNIEVDNIDNNMQNIRLSDDVVSNTSLDDNNLENDIPLSNDTVVDNTMNEVGIPDNINIENNNDIENNIENTKDETQAIENNIVEDFQPQITTIDNNDSINNDNINNWNATQDMALPQENTPQDETTPIIEEPPTITEISAKEQNEEPQIVEQLPASSMAKKDETTNEVQKEEKEEKNKKEKKKKSKLGLIIFLMLIIMIITAGIVVAMKFCLKSPYEATVSKVFSMAKSNYDPSKSYRLSGLITLDTTDEALKVFNNYSIDYTTEVDPKTKNSLLKLNLNENNIPLIDLATYLTGDKLYIQSDKILQNVYYISNIVNSDILNTEDEQYIINTTEKALKSAFKDEKATTEDITLAINGKSISAKNYYYKINSESLKRIVTNIVEVYENDSKAIQIMAKTSNEVTEANIKEALNELKEMEYSDINIKLGFYTQGILNDIIGFNLSQDNTKVVEYVFDNDYSLLTINGVSLSSGFIAETKKGVCNIKLVQDNEEQLIATITKINDKENVADIYLSDTTTLKLESKIEENINVGSFDIASAKDFNGMTEEELQLISERTMNILQNSAIYPYVEQLLNSANYNNNMDYTFDDSLLDIETNDWNTMQPQTPELPSQPVQ